MKKNIRYLILILVVLVVTSVKVYASENVERISGKDRVETSIKVSGKAYDKSDVAVLAGYNGEIDALTGTLLASSKNAPLLLTYRDNVDSRLSAELERLEVKRVYILGGEAVVSKAVETELKKDKYIVKRIKGSNREATAIAVLNEVGSKTKHVFLAKGYGALVDALAIGPVSAKKNMPVLLTHTDYVPQTTLDAMEELKITDVTIVGGRAAVSEAAAAQLKDYKVDRVSGSDRVNTALKIAEKYFNNPKHTIIANGWKYADALVGGYFAAKNNGPILLSSDTKIATESVDYIAKNRTKTYVLGGEKMVNNDVINYINLTLNQPIELVNFSIDGMQMAHAQSTIKVEVKNPKDLLYRFQVKESNSNNWTVVKKYSSDSTASWIPDAQGTHDYKVDIKYKSSLNDSDFSKENKIEIKPLAPAVITKLEIKGNGYRNTNHTIVAETTSINKVLYKFILKNETTGKSTIKQEFKENNSVNWKPENPGKYSCTVLVKDIKSSKVEDDTLTETIRINMPVYYNTTDYKQTLDQALDEQILKGSNRIYTSSGKRPATKDEIKIYLDPNNYLQFDPKEYSENEMIGVVTASSLNVRTGPGTGHEIIGKTTLGQAHKILEENNGWSKINFDGINGWISSSYLKKETNTHLISAQVGVASLNLRKDPNSSSQILTTLKEGQVYIVLDEKDGWYKINAKNNIDKQIGWISSAYTNSVRDVPRDMYQYMLLSGQAGATADQLNRELVGQGILTNKGSSFIEASKKYNVNELYLLAHSIHETGRGTSALAIGTEVSEVNGQPVEPKTVYNMYGIGAVDNSPLKSGSERAYTEGWFTPEIAIVEGANWISKNYINNSKYNQDTLYKMRYNSGGAIWHQYATDIAWAYKQITQIDRTMELSNKMDSVILRFDIPNYKNE